MEANRSDYRNVFYSVWEKIQKKEIIADATESIIASVINQHPEYHYIFENFDRYSDKDFAFEEDEVNPFMHLSMHIAIAEQLMADEPAGIKLHYQKLSTKLKDSHEAEHHLADCLTQLIWHSQRYQVKINMKKYLKCVKQKIASF